MKRIKDYFRRNRVTLMLVPQSNRSIRQIKFNLVAAFSILLILILANVVLLTNSIYNQVVADRLTDVNTQLESNLQQEKDRISSLESIAASSKE
ncbi:MAG: hypothetical protein Q4A52_03330, partial [Bacillota bacterium]|nr:hypothetical protein [Bacillota bacterium]